MTVLDRIVADVREDLAFRMAARVTTVEADVAARPPARDFHAALGNAGVSLIAEVKRASPSRGPIRPDVDPVDVALTYAASGADAISILTEGRHFGGSLDHLTGISSVLGTDGPPVLQKDFIVDPYQVYEARAHGADCVLLIAALLSQRWLVHMLHLSRELGMASLVEVHDEVETDRAVASGARIVGINNRNLHTLEVDLATFERLRPRIPDGHLVVGESGVRAREDIERLSRIGVDAVLVGEAIMSAPDIGMKVREFRCAMYT